MSRKIDIYPLVEAEILFDRNYSILRRTGINKDNAEVIRCMFRFSKAMDTFSCMHLPLSMIFEEEPYTSPLFLEYEEVRVPLMPVYQAFDNLMDAINRSNASFGESFHRDIDRIKAIIHIFREAYNRHTP